MGRILPSPFFTISVNKHRLLPTTSHSSFLLRWLQHGTTLHLCLLTAKDHQLVDRKAQGFHITKVLLKSQQTLKLMNLFQGAASSFDMFLQKYKKLEAQK